MIIRIDGKVRWGLSFQPVVKTILMHANILLFYVKTKPIKDQL